MERFAIKIDKKLKANLYKICRLCGIDNPDMVPILTDKPPENAIDVEAEMEMSQKINLLIGLSVTKDDRMPQTMCCLCVDKINDFYEFREMCYATNAQTRKLLGLKNIKKPAVDIKPKVEVKEESIVPTNTLTLTPANNKNGNRKRKSEDVALKDEIPATSGVLSKKKLRFSTAAEPSVKEEAPVVTKKKLRFTPANDEPTALAASSTKKLKNAIAEDSKLKKEPSPPVPATPPFLSNKKLRLAVPPQKELTNKKSKQKVGKNAEQKEVDVKEEIKEEIKEEPAPVLPSAKIPSTIKVPPAPKIPPAPKLKFGCNICKERFAAKVNLDTHTRNTHIPTIERYVCTACNEVLSKSFDIKNHQLWHKLSKTPFVCGCCGESILNTYAFSRHLREHAFETPPALLVLDRECPQCHTSYATNFLYNIHICAVKTKRCAGCNRLQRNDAEYLKHSAQCAKVYLNYSKHIMPSVEALEDAVRIKNENDVEAAAEEMARISGVSLDMAPVVQLTRLSSPIIMAANHCVSMTGLDDAASTSSKKSGKKGVSKKDLKRVDELLKSTLDALVSIKHEPEVHVETETPCAGEHSDNDDHNERHEEAGGTYDYAGGDFHHNDDSDIENEETNTTANVHNTSEISLEQIRIKQEIDEISEENANKIGGGLKLKIKKEHGQLNSSIIEQQKSSEKRAEKRKKKKKHKDKEKDKQKLSKDMQDEQVSQDSNGNNNNNSEENVMATIRIKAEPQDRADAADMSVVPKLQLRPQPEATIMTSIPMMQFQIACVSSGVEFSNAASAVVETPNSVATANPEAETLDVKPNREELDRMLKITHVSSGIDMETNETENENEDQPMDHDGNDIEEEDVHEGSNEDDHHDEDNKSECQDDNRSEHGEIVEEDLYKTGNDNPEVIAKKIKKSLGKPKSKLTLKPKIKPELTITKSRNKACKSTSKPGNMPVLQISAVHSGVALGPPTSSIMEFTPIFIKPEPQNRGYSDEQPSVEESPSQAEVPDTAEESEELSHIHSTEEQNYISSIDFNNITIKQEKDIEINDVQISQKSVRSYARINGIKRKRKRVHRTHIVRDKTSEGDENREEDEDHETDEDIEEENDDQDAEEVEEEEEDEEEDEDDEDVEEEEEEEEEEEDVEDEEEREYRELEYPPELIEKNVDIESKTTEGANKILDAGGQESKQENDNQVIPNENINVINQGALVAPTEETPSFVIASVCSQVSLKNSDQLNKESDSKLIVNNSEHGQALLNHEDKLLTPTTSSDVKNSTMKTITEENPKKPHALALNLTDESPAPNAAIQETFSNNLSVVASSCNISDVAIETSSAEISQVAVAHAGSHATITTHDENTHPLQPTLPTPTPVLQQMSLQLGHPFEVRLVGQLTQDLSSSQESLNLDLALQSSEITQNSLQAMERFDTVTQEQLSVNPSMPTMQHVNQTLQGNSVLELSLTPQHNLQYPGQEEVVVVQQENPQNSSIEGIANVQDRPQENLQNSCELPLLDNQVNTSPGQDRQFTLNVTEVYQNSTDFANPSQTSHGHQPVLKLESVTSTAVGINPEFNNLLKNNDGQDTLEDNQEEAAIEGVVEQAKDLKLEAQPIVSETTQNLQTDNEMDVDENYENEDENELEDENDGDEDSTWENNNLEERQNYQNQEVLSQIRPAALALHPYLEDISSSSNSLLSNSLSQTPPPTAQSTRDQQQRLLNTEETENILNESNDVISRRSAEVASTSAASTRLTSQHLQPHLAQQLPPHMPTFNFDNINEIAENNNNANIEREQLQDEQQQQQQQQQTTNIQ